ncbi:MAG: hypothetical protein FWF88_02225 [Peptococcaceae bacterium]|nr:hypothetical protein [Peptococcaceae bacterium]
MSYERLTGREYPSSFESFLSEMDRTYVITFEVNEMVMTAKSIKPLTKDEADKVIEQCKRSAYGKYCNLDGLTDMHKVEVTTTVTMRISGNRAENDSVSYVARNKGEWRVLPVI